MIEKKNNIKSIEISNDDIKDILNITLCICAKDGIISEIELRATKEQFKNIFRKNITSNKIEKFLEDFFKSSVQIEEYLERVTKEELRRPILQLALLSAASDGFNIKENLAYQKALAIWNYSSDEVLEEQ